MVVHYLKSTKIYNTLKSSTKANILGMAMLCSIALSECFATFCEHALQHCSKFKCFATFGKHVFQHCSQCFATFGKHVLLQHCSKCFATFGKHALQHCPQCFATFGKHALQHCSKCFATFGTCFAALFSMFCNIW